MGCQKRHKDVFVPRSSLLTSSVSPSISPSSSKVLPTASVKISLTKPQNLKAIYIYLIVKNKSIPVFLQDWPIFLFQIQILSNVKMMGWIESALSLMKK